MVQLFQDFNNARESERKRNDLKTPDTQVRMKKKHVEFKNTKRNYLKSCLSSFATLFLYFITLLCFVYSYRMLKCCQSQTSHAYLNGNTLCKTQAFETAGDMNTFSNVDTSNVNTVIELNKYP
jgi:hypothetical protein